MGQWADKTYGIKNEGILTAVANYLEGVSSKKREVEIWTSYFNGNDKTAFARINRESMEIELGKMASKAVRRGIEQILENKEGGTD